MIYDRIFAVISRRRSGKRGKSTKKNEDHESGTDMLSRTPQILNARALVSPGDLLNICIQLIRLLLPMLQRCRPLMIESFQFLPSLSLVLIDLIWDE